MRHEFGAPALRKSGFPVWAWLIIVPCGCSLLVIPILAAILFPVFAQARANARGTSCMGNVRQQSTGALMYSQDYDEILPTAEAWMDVTAPYRRGEDILHCPEVSQKGSNAFGYAYDKRVSRRPLAEIAKPNFATMLYDSSNLVRNANDRFTSLPSPKRHTRGNNVGFVDGHVKAQRTSADEQTLR